MCVLQEKISIQMNMLPLSWYVFIKFLFCIAFELYCNTFCLLLAHCVNGLGCYRLVLHDIYVCLVLCLVANYLNGSS